MKKLPILFLAAALVSLAAVAAADDKYTVYREVTILHTNDLHSHLNGFAPEHDYTPLTTGDDDTRGGFARLAALVSSERIANTSSRGSVLFLDAGDFTMGTVFETISPVFSPELRLLHELGCDATTLGNHEFDWGPTGTSYIVNAAGGTGDRVPILASNIVFDPADPGDDALAGMAAAGFIRPYLIKTLPNGLRIGMFGLMGRNAALVVPQAAPVTFRDPIAAAADMVTLLQAQKVDLIVCISHSGVWPDPTVSEDEILARYVPGIDVIVSGHTHTLLPEPIVVAHEGTTRKTWIVQSGEFGEHLGELKLRVFNSKPPEIESYHMLSVDDSVLGDAGVQKEIDALSELVDATVRPFDTRQVVAKTAFPVERGLWSEAPLGNLVCDAMRATVSALTAPLDGHLVDFAFEKLDPLPRPAQAGEDRPHPGVGRLPRRTARHRPRPGPRLPDGDLLPDRRRGEDGARGHGHGRADGRRGLLPPGFGAPLHDEPGRRTFQPGRLHRKGGRDPRLRAVRFFGVQHCAIQGRDQPLHRVVRRAGGGDDRRRADDRAEGARRNAGHEPRFAHRRP